MTRNRTRASSLAAVVLVLALAGASSLSPAEGAQGVPLTRTIYVPVHFAVDQRILDDIRIWIEQEDGEPMELSTRPHTFMFTLYPGTSAGFRPERIEVRLQALSGCPAAGLDANFFVTPLGIISSEGSLAFDVQKVMKQLQRGRKRDVRVPKQLVRIKCPENDELRAADPDTDPDADSGSNP